MIVNLLLISTNINFKFTKFYQTGMFPHIPMFKTNILYMRSLFYNVIVFSFGTKVFGVSDDVIHKVNTVTAKSATDLSIISIKKLHTTISN